MIEREPATTPVLSRSLTSAPGPRKGEHTGPESVLELEHELVSQMVRAIRHDETEKAMGILRELCRSCFNQGAAMQRKSEG